jgi:hypothetical protein
MRWRLESVGSFRFDQFEMYLLTLWSGLGGSHRKVVHAPGIAGLMAKVYAIVNDVSVIYLIQLLNNCTRKFWRYYPPRCSRQSLLRL